MAVFPYPLMSEHVQDEDGDSLQGIEDGEDPCKDNGAPVDDEQAKDPGQPQQWQQDKRGLHYVPAMHK